MSNKLLQTPAGKATQGYEFTPIGFQKENSIDNLSKLPPPPSTIKRRRASNSDKRRKLAKFDESFEDAADESFDTRALRRDVTNHTFKPRNTAILSGSNPLKEQQDQVTKLNDENYNLKVKLTSLMKFLNQVDDSEGSKMKLFAQLEEMTLQTNGLKEKIRTLNEQNKELKEQADNAAEPVVETVVDTKVVEEIRLQLEDVQRENMELSMLKDQMEKKLTEATERGRLQGTANSKEFEKLKADIAGKENELMEIKLVLSDTKQQLAQQEALLKEKVDMLEQQKKDHMDHSKLQNDADVFKIRQLEGDISDLQLAVKMKTAEVTARDERIARLQQQLLEFDHQGGELLQYEAQLKSKEDAIGNLQLRVQEYQKQSQKDHYEIEELKQKLSSSSKDQTVSDIQREKKQLQEELDLVKQRLQNVMQQSELMSEKNRKLQATIQDSITNSSESDAFFKKLEKENAELHAKLKALEGSYDEENITLKELLKTTERRYQSSLETSKDEIHRLQQLNRELEGRTMHDDDRLEFIRIRNSQENEIKLLKLELVNIKEQYDHEKQFLQDKVNKLRAENERYAGVDVSSQENLVNKLADRAREISELTDRVGRMVADKLDLQRTIEKLQLREEQLARDNSNLKSQLQYAIDEDVRTRLTRECQRLQRDNLDMERDILKFQEKLAHYKEQYKVLASENGDLQSKNQLLTQVLEASRAHLKQDISRMRDVL